MEEDPCKLPETIKKTSLLKACHNYRDGHLQANKKRTTP